MTITNQEKLNWLLLGIIALILILLVISYVIIDGIAGRSAIENLLHEAIPEAVVACLIVILAYFFLYRMDISPLGHKENSGMNVEEIATAIASKLQAGMNVEEFATAIASKLQTGMNAEEFATAIASKLQARNNLPNVIQTTQYGTPQKFVLILERSTLFVPNALVSVYYEEESFEHFICIGNVQTIQDSGAIQILVEKEFEDFDLVRERLVHNDATVLRKIRVKPSVPREYLDKS